MSTKNQAAAPQVTYVYRFYNAEEQLLYVGIAKDIKSRFRQHAKDKAWWGEVARSVSEECLTLALALAKESTAILTESPKYNLAIPTLARHDTLQARAELDPLLSMPIMERLKAAENDGRRLGFAKSDLARLQKRFNSLQAELEGEQEAAFTARADVAKLTRGLRDMSCALAASEATARQRESELSRERAARVAAERRVQELELEAQSRPVAAPRRSVLGGIFTKARVAT